MPRLSALSSVVAALGLVLFVSSFKAGEAPRSTYAVPAPAVPPYYQVFYPASGQSGDLVYPVA